jgi:hypothetical protein
VGSTLIVLVSPSLNEPTANYTFEYSHLTHISENGGSQECS